MQRKHLLRSFTVYLIVCFIVIGFASLWRASIIEFSNAYEGTDFEKMEHISIRKTLLVSFYVSTLLALLTSLVDVFFLKKILGRRSLGQVILFSAIAQALIIVFVIINANRFYIQIVFDANPRIKNNIWEVPDLGYITILMIVSVALARFIIEIDRKLGKGNLWLYLIGRFYKPHEEKRIFMFVDLKSSTTIAEKIGHYKFSQLIQDCFSDLSVVERYDTEVYQYVGDEVVLTWSGKKGLKKLNYIRAFYAFKDKLKSKEEYYKNKYGVVPEFKAGANLGLCTVTEVGDLKREICYHGDTLNTAARIESLCNEFEADLMISEYLYEKVEEKDKEKYVFEPAGYVELKGKVNKVGLFKVS